MGQRLLAVVVVIAAACTALQYSMTGQKSVVVSNNPYHFPMGGSQVFVLSPSTQMDDDIVQSIAFSSCTSQWQLDTMIDAQGSPPGVQVCGGITTPSAAPPNGDNFAACPTNYQFGVTFAGTQPGMSSCNVIITTMKNGGSATGLDQVTLMLTGSGSGTSGITVMPSRIDFGDVQINTTSLSQAITVKNNNGSGITVNGNLTGTGFASVPSIGTFNLGSGSSTAFNVTCHPTVVGPLAGSASFATSTQNLVAMLDCKGIDSTVTVTPSAVTFASTLVGRPPPPRTVMIGGNSAAVIQQVTLDAAATAAGVTITMNPQGQTIGGGKIVELSYSAASMHELGPLGSLSIKFDVDVAARMVGISGEALLGGVGTNPASVEFGAVCAGATVMKDIEVYASEPGNVMVQQLVKPGAPFDATSADNLPKMLAGNHSGPSVTLHATLAPTAAGDFKDALVLKNDVPNLGDREVELHGIALSSGIAATPNVVHFGTTGAGTTTSIKEVQFTNCGTTDLMFTGRTITGPNATEFTLIGANPPRTIKPTESEIFMVVMQPETEGLKSAKLVITHDMGSTVADLDGTGEGGGNKDRETYYACSTGRGGGLWPILIALLALRRRRR